MKTSKKSKAPVKGTSKALKPRSSVEVAKGSHKKKWFYFDGTLPEFSIPEDFSPPKVFSKIAQVFPNRASNESTVEEIWQQFREADIKSTSRFLAHATAILTTAINRAKFDRLLKGQGAIADADNAPSDTVERSEILDGRVLKNAFDAVSYFSEISKRDESRGIESLIQISRWCIEILETIPASQNHQFAASKVERYPVLLGRRKELSEAELQRIEALKVGSKTLIRTVGNAKGHPFSYGENTMNRCARALIEYIQDVRDGKLPHENSTPQKYDTYGFHKKIMKLPDFRKAPHKWAEIGEQILTANGNRLSEIPILLPLGKHREKHSEGKAGKGHVGVSANLDDGIRKRLFQSFLSLAVS